MNDENYEVPLEEQEINQSLQNTGRNVNNFGRSVVNNFNNGLKSSNKSLDNKNNLDKNQETIPNSNQNQKINPINNANNGNNKTGLKEKINSFKNDISEKNPINKFKKKIDEKNPLKKISNKITEKISPIGMIFSKVKFIGIISIILILALIIIVAIVGHTGANIILHNITSDFICSMEEPFPTNTWNVTKTYGWYLVDTGETETVTTMVTKTNSNGQKYEEEESEEYPIYEALFHDGISISASNDTKVFSVQPGMITDVGSNYVVIDHNKNGEYKVDDVNKYVTKYSNLSSIFKDINVGTLTVKKTTLGYVGNNPIFIQIIKNNEGLDINQYFGYSLANSVCGNKNSITTTRGTVANEDIKLIMDNNCNNLPNKINREEWLNNSCAIEYGTPLGEYTSLMCGSQDFNAKGPSKAQCAGGVYQYFNSFLPGIDAATWNKYLQIYGNAVDYWTNNNLLGSLGFKADQNPTPGSLWVSGYSNARCDNGKPCGHIMAVISVSGDNVNVFECNYNGKEGCWYHTYTKQYLSSYKGFLGYIHILGDC